MLLVQRDVTKRARLEGVLEELSRSQLAILCEVGGWVGVDGWDLRETLNPGWLEGVLEELSRSQLAMLCKVCVYIRVHDGACDEMHEGCSGNK